MSKRFLRTVTLLALSALTTLALAQAPVPARVGRVSLAEGQVSIGAEAGDTVAALVNWPVTSRNTITTEGNGRAEFRVGSTALRLDAGSSLEVTQLDDDNLRLRLHYGSVNVSIRNPEALRGFELATAQGRVRMQEPGRMRVDADRGRGAVHVFDGVALVDAGGSALMVRAGRRAEMRGDDVLTGMAVGERFDDWAAARDRLGERSVSSRYVTTEMTGYEELDRNGAWRDDAEYGPLWLPRSVPSGWAPYRDGQWTWIAPWGWTWIDNAPWGYAPFHYGRWVHVDQRWAWAPGRDIGRPVWAPALVGWIGGSGWSASFASRHAVPAQGWYPLSPGEAWVPGYSASQEHLRHINRHARGDHRRGHDDDRRGAHRRYEGVTVVPHAQFGQRGSIVVSTQPKAQPSPLALQDAPAAAPPAPAAARRHGRELRMDGRELRMDGRSLRAGGFERRLDEGIERAAPQPAPQRDGRAGFDERRRQGAGLYEDGRHAERRSERAPSMPAPLLLTPPAAHERRAPPQAAPAAAPAPVPAAVPAPARVQAPAPAPAAQPERPAALDGRMQRNEGRGLRGADGVRVQER